MKNKFYTLKNIYFFILLAIALIITLDFLLPGNSHHEKITRVSQHYERYYNAGNNQHYSYKLQTKSRKFYISESFSKQASKNDSINYKTSLIFNQVNSFYTNSNTSSTYSLRYVSGLFVPLFTVLIVLLSYFSKKNMDILLFVTTMLLFADLVFLIL